MNISGLQPDKTYVFTVVGVSSGRLGESSESLTVTTQKEVHVAGPPTLVIATAVSASAILVQWQAPEYANGPVVKYQVFYVEVHAVLLFKACTNGVLSCLINH